MPTAFPAKKAGNVSMIRHNAQRLLSKAIRACERLVLGNSHLAQAVESRPPATLACAVRSSADLSREYDEYIRANVGAAER